MTVIFSKVEAEITEDLINKFSSEFDFDAMLRKVCEDAGVFIEIETFLEENVNPDHIEQKKYKYKLRGVWVSMEKAYRNLVTTVALYGSRMDDDVAADGDTSDILDNPLSSTGCEDEEENVVSKSVLEDYENKTKRRPRKSAVQSRKLISTMTKDVGGDDDIFEDCEIACLKSEQDEKIKGLTTCEEVDLLTGKENKSSCEEDKKSVDCKKGRGRPRKALSTKKSKKRGRPKKYEDGEVPAEFPCNQCSYVAKRRYKLKSHILEVHQTNPSTCPICNKTFPNKRYMIRHQESHGGPQHCCDICGKMYKIKKAMQNHRKTHEPTYKKPSFQCEECPKSFCNQYVLDVHVRDIHRGLKKSYLCSICGKSFTTKHSLSEHSNAHNGLKPYECETCGKTFSYESALRDHKFSHSEKSFWCRHCQKSFSQRSGLKMHMRTHRLNKMFICSECGRGFTQKQALQRHERVHKGEKPFICKHCGKHFTDASIVRRHLILVHKIEKSAKVWREDIICTIVADKEHHVQRISEEIQDKYSSIEKQKEEVMRSVGLQIKPSSKKGPSRAFQRTYPRKVVVLDDEDNIIAAPDSSVTTSAPSVVISGKNQISLAQSSDTEIQLKTIDSQPILSDSVIDTAEIDPQIINERYVEQTQWDVLTKGTAQLQPIILEETNQSDEQRTQDQVLNLQKIIKCENIQNTVSAETNSHQVEHQILHSPQYSPVAFTSLNHSNSSKMLENQFETLTAQVTNTSGQYYDIRGSNHSAVPWSSMYYYSHLANQLGINIGSDISYINAASSSTTTHMSSCIMQTSIETQQISATSLVVHKPAQEMDSDSLQSQPTHLSNAIVPSNLDSTNNITCVTTIPTLLESNTINEQKANSEESPNSNVQPSNSTVML